MDVIPAALSHLLLFSGGGFESIALEALSSELGR